MKAGDVGSIARQRSNPTASEALKVAHTWWPCMRLKNRKGCMEDKWKDE